MLLNSKSKIKCGKAKTHPNEKSFQYVHIHIFQPESGCIQLIFNFLVFMNHPKEHEKSSREDV